MSIHLKGTKSYKINDLNRGNHTSREESTHVNIDHTRETRTSVHLKMDSGDLI